MWCWNNNNNNNNSKNEFPTGEILHEHPLKSEQQLDKSSKTTQDL